MFGSSSTTRTLPAGGVSLVAFTAHIVSELPVRFLRGVAVARSGRPQGTLSFAPGRSHARGAPWRHETHRRDRHPRVQRGSRAGAERAPPPLLLLRGAAVVLPDRDRRQRERRPHAGDRRPAGRRAGARLLPAPLREGPRPGAAPGLVAQRRRGA